MGTSTGVDLMTAPLSSAIARGALWAITAAVLLAGAALAGEAGGLA